MCLITSNPIKTAVHDITAWKCIVVHEGREEAGIPYRWSGPYHPDKEFLFEKHYIDEVEYVMDLGWPELHQIGKDFFHSVESYADAELILREHQGLYGSRLRICKCTIPKGTLYFHDDGQYASKAIIVHCP